LVELKNIIAIDGPAASGKTAVGRLVARKLGINFLDTGIMYRAATLIALGKRINPNDEIRLVKLVNSLNIEYIFSNQKDRLLVDGNDITDELNSDEINNNVSLVSKVAGVRNKLVDTQRTIAYANPIVVVGRDIGTVVIPNAPVKIYLTAKLQVRAKRRYNELKLRDVQVNKSEEQVLREMAERDAMDSQRVTSPLEPAKDAILIDSGHLTVRETAKKIILLTRDIF